MAVIQRPLKGSRISSFYPVKSLPPLSALDSAFQLQEYISLLIRLDVHDVERIVSIPGKSTSDNNESAVGEDKDGKNEVLVDEACWIYEQLKRLAQDLSHPLITTLQQECNRASCPQMKAGDWLYLCVAHGNETALESQTCCAIDYILHTLDSATALLNSPRAFPSRLSIPPTSTRHFSSLARRLGRIFSHAYYHHREAFEQAEAESSLYGRFIALSRTFNLVPSEFLVVPPRLSHLIDEHESESRQDEPQAASEADADDRSREPRQWLTLNDSSSVVNLSQDRGTSPPGSATIAGTASPRRMGRSRTDTMVYSEAASVAEELAKNESFTEADIDRAIAEERMLAAVAQSVSDASPSELERDEVEDLKPELHGTDLSDAPGESEHPAIEAEVLLEIAAPEPAEPAVPSEVDDEDDAPDSDEGEPLADELADVNHEALDDVEAVVDLQVPEEHAEEPVLENQDEITHTLEETEIEQPSSSELPEEDDSESNTTTDIPEEPKPAELEDTQALVEEVPDVEDLVSAEAVTTEAPVADSEAAPTTNIEESEEAPVNEPSIEEIDKEGSSHLEAEIATEVAPKHDTEEEV